MCCRVLTTISAVTGGSRGLGRPYLPNQQHVGRCWSPLPDRIGEESGIRFPKPFPQRNLGVPTHG
jgi:hypothetical protein